MAKLYLGTREVTPAIYSGGSARSMGEIVMSTIPLTDSKLHLLDGSVLNSSNYSDFVNYIGSLYSDDSTASYFAQPSNAELWTQPTMTANGTLGGNSFAVYSNVTQISSDAAVYKAFDNNDQTFFHSTSNNKTGYITMYNPTALNVVRIETLNQDNCDNRASAIGKVYGSNDNSNWTELTSYANSVQAGGESWYIDLSSNTNYYNYYKLDSTTGGSDYYWVIEQINLTAYTSGASTPEQNWQNELTIRGICDKFVYDSTNSTVRIPQYGGKLAVNSTLEEANVYYYIVVG